MVPINYNWRRYTVQVYKCMTQDNSEFLVYIHRRGPKQMFLPPPGYLLHHTRVKVTQNSSCNDRVTCIHFYFEYIKLFERSYVDSDLCRFTFRVQRYWGSRFNKSRGTIQSLYDSPSTGGSVEVVPTDSPHGYVTTTET